MEQDDENQETSPSRLTTRRVGFGVLYALLLAVIGNALWDLLVSPGLGASTRFLLTIVTLGSERIRDEAYRTAALDPTPLSPLIGILIVTSIPMMLMGAVTADILFDRRKVKRVSKEAKNATTLPEVDESLAKINASLLALRRILSKIRILLLVLLLVASAIFYTAAFTLNQSVVIWRVFHANLTICAPYLSEREEELLKARFAGMRRRVDYQAIDSELRGVAKTNGVKLIEGEVW